MHFVFNSVAEFAREAEACREYGRLHSGWAGPDDWDETMRKATQGDTSAVEEAEKLLSKLQTCIEVKHRAWVSDVAGFYPSVPDHLAGHPEHMRRMTEVPSDQAPVRVWFDPTSSGGIDSDDLVRRGTTILALVMALSSSRPVELWVISGSCGNKGARVSSSKEDEFYNVMVKINSQPLMLSEASVALSHVGFCRQLIYAKAKKHGWSGRWSTLYSKHGAVESTKIMLGNYYSPQDIIIPPIHVTEDQIIKDPLGWINKHLDSFRTEQELA